MTLMLKNFFRTRVNTENADFSVKKQKKESVKIGVQIKTVGQLGRGLVLSFTVFAVIFTDVSQGTFGTLGFARAANFSS